MEKIKLFCLPHAGGSSIYYSQWRKIINTDIEIIPLELSGRGRRYAEEFYNNFDEALSDLFNEISIKLDNNEFAIFGHSMGAILAYELAYKIKETKDKEALTLFFSGRCPPHIVENEKYIYLLPDKQFIDEIIKYGGIPKEVLAEKELMEMVIPILRADFRVLNTYKYIQKEHKFNCDIVALTGKDDEGVNIKNFLQWKEHTNSSCIVHEFQGGHFYLKNNISKIINIISEKLLVSQR